MPFHATLLASVATRVLAPQADPGASEPAPTYIFAIAPQDLESALLAVSRTSGREVLFAADLVAGRRTQPLAGRFTAEEAVRRLLRGTGLVSRGQSGAILIVAAAEAVQAESPTAEVVVTGSRIRGGQAYAPVTSASREALRAQGQTDLGAALRNLPQNFGGGQNPYVGVGAEDFGSDNLNSGSSVNLRGLGADATLTLLNGRRLAYDGVGEGVDISAIPIAAIDRVEIVADGASAIYGSDAVAGVANVILRRDVSGLEASAHLGGATDGGDVQKQLDLVAGTTWSTGGLVATGSYVRSSDVYADQRRFSRQLDSTTTIVPRIDQLSAVLSGHQAFGERAEAQLDLLYSRRTSYLTYPNAPNSSYLESGVDRHLDAASLAASPSFRFDLGSRWSATINGNYARDHLEGHGRYYLAGATIVDATTIYTNQSVGGEGSIEGPLVALPGGDARLAAGLGYRWVGLTSDRSSVGGETSRFAGNRDSYYAFGELNVPLVGAANASAGLYRLSANIAGRYEHYPRLGDVITPKLGLLYAPARFLEIRGTWGRSFKAPTLYQLYEAQGALLFTADLFGGTGYAANATAIYAYGGNRNLRPQRATSWSVGTVLTPLSDRRLTLEATYFRTRYTDRIATPFTSVLTALSDPAVSDLVTFEPGETAIDALVASTQLGLVNYSGYPYDPATVVAIIDDRNRNIAAQTISGVDVSAAWRVALGPNRSVSFNASATYLRSERQVSAGQPVTVLAGTIFNPPHLRARLGASLDDGPFSASAFATVVGGVEDRRFVPRERVAGQTSVDLAASYAFQAGRGGLHGVKVQLSMLNAFNDLPARIRTGDPTFTPFDAANYSPVGRFVSVAVTKKW